ncbi:MAG: hypothetical protein ABI794_13810 [Betaproteobacteria bacterium]
MNISAGSATARSLLVALFAFPAMATANLVQYGLMTADDGLVTLDTATGLEWLRLPLTAGHSFNEVAAGYGGYTTQYGFHSASRGTVARLFSNAGGTTGFGGASQIPAASELTLHLGYAEGFRNVGSSITHYFTQGMMAPESDTPGVPVAILYVLFDKQTAVQGQTDWTGQGYVGLDNASPEYASFLVRSATSPFGPSPTQPPDVFPPPEGPFPEPPPLAIPEPASAALWFVGLAAVLMRRSLRGRVEPGPGARQ